jgi:hypothetical protein
MPEVDTRPMCDRVVIDNQGRVTRPDDAFHHYGAITRVIFVRGDGWSVGCPEEFELVGYSLWQREWREFRRWPDYALQPISEYRLPRKKRSG